VSSLLRAGGAFQTVQRRKPSAFAKARIAESGYARHLRALSRHIGELVRSIYDAERPAESAAEAAEALRRYAKLIDPWARAVGRRMLVDVSARDATAWRRLSREIGARFADEVLGDTATSALIRERLDEQVRLITSLPEEAASRVMALAREGLTTGRRADQLREDILRTGQVTVSRANLIARTETGRAASEVTRARAEFIGSDGYIWRTAHDADVRERHRELEGTFHRWDDPPIAGESGERAHPGAIYNCRCHPEPIVPRS
jgi:SPP1 gp7 family putative phage head morphogenesis protein